MMKRFLLVSALFFCYYANSSFAQTPLFASVYYCENIYCRETHLILYSDSTVIFSRGPRSTEQQLYKARLTPVEFRSLKTYIDSCKPEIMTLRNSYPAMNRDHCGTEVVALFGEDSNKVIRYCPYNNSGDTPPILMSISKKMYASTGTFPKPWHPDNIEVEIFTGAQAKKDNWPKTFPPLDELTVTRPKPNSSWYETSFPYKYLPALEKYCGKKAFTYNGRMASATMKFPLPGEKLWTKP